VTAFLCLWRFLFFLVLYHVCFWTHQQLPGIMACAACPSSGASIVLQACEEISAVAGERCGCCLCLTPYDLCGVTGHYPDNVVELVAGRAVLWLSSANRGMALMEMRYTSLLPVVQPVFRAQKESASDNEKNILATGPNDRERFRMNVAQSKISKLRSSGGVSTVSSVHTASRVVGVWQELGTTRAALQALVANV